MVLTSSFAAKPRLLKESCSNTIFQYLNILSFQYFKSSPLLHRPGQVIDRILFTQGPNLLIRASCCYVYTPSNVLLRLPYHITFLHFLQCPFITLFLTFSTHFHTLLSCLISSSTMKMRLWKYPAVTDPAMNNFLEFLMILRDQIYLINHFCI